MTTGLRRLTLMSRLSISAVLAFVCMVVIMSEAIDTIHELVYEDRQVKTRHLVETAYSVLKQFHESEQAGAMTTEQAQAGAIKVIKGLRYEEKEYFWINDLGKPAPKMIMHPTVPALDGKILDDAKFNRATMLQAGLDGPRVKADKTNLFAAFVTVADKAGQGYVEYLWPKPKAGGGVTDELFTKLSYVKKFEPWGWVVGSGIYIDDVENIFWQHATHSLALAIGGTLILLGAAWVVRRSIIGEFGGEPRVAAGITSRIAEGDLTQEIRLRNGDGDSLLFVLSRMQANLKDMLRAVFSNAHQVESSIVRLSAESNEINLATQLQANAIEQTRSAINNISLSVETVNVLAGDTEQGSQEVARRARAGADVAVKVAEEMNAIADTVAASSAEVSRLVASTQEIDKMANVIKDIADQTNLLALNAAIEAARAGEQGRGFAVVADEVRKLAERTAKATSEIGRILHSIQGDTERAVKGMDAAAPVIAKGVTQANSAAETLHAIEEQAKETLLKMQQLAEATHDQTRQIAEIVGNVDEVMHASGRTENVIRQSQQTSSELEKSANEMFSMVQRFNVGEVAVASRQRADNGPAVALMEWSSALAVGHAEIDRQHQVLIAIANRLNAAMHAGHGREIAGPILNELVNYTLNHFDFEEKLMEKHAYAGRNLHAAEHKKLIADVSKFKQQFDSGNAGISIELMGFIRDWLVNHILKVDKDLSHDLARKEAA
ncbi:bacteriohemerythrin [Dechloromonas sp. A34]|uniref:bacteriohemerythrin n=1 Tax=Dechloromonas sp. A34 TaxID=447588 RepID=UPI00224886C2|nr:bacteriohemerythrin [Dechloromonas sp. A34]